MLTTEDIEKAADAGKARARATFTMLGTPSWRHEVAFAVRNLPITWPSPELRLEAIDQAERACAAAYEAEHVRLEQSLAALPITVRNLRRNAMFEILIDETVNQANVAGLEKVVLRADGASIYEVWRWIRMTLAGFDDHKDLAAILTQLYALLLVDISHALGLT